MVVFYDLNLKWDKTTAIPLMKTAENLGFSRVAFNHNIKSFKKKTDLDKIVKDFNEELEAVRKRNPTKVKVFSRLTFFVSDMIELNLLKRQEMKVSSIDILAVNVNSEPLFHQCCNDFNYDIVSFSINQKIPFYPKRKSIKSAIRRKIFIEIPYSNFVSDDSSRKHFLQNVKTIVSLTKGKNLILSSGSSDPMDLRGPYDLINLMCLFSLNQSTCREAISENCLSVFKRKLSRTTFSECVGSKRLADLTEAEEWKKPKILDVEEINSE